VTIMSAQQDSGSSRATFLPVALAGIVLLFFLLMLILITGGFIFWCVLCAAVATAVITMHWLVWGRLLTQLTAGEREEEQLLERAREPHEPEWRVYRR
jgi:hypothetical protein